MVTKSFFIRTNPTHLKCNKLQHSDITLTYNVDFFKMINMREIILIKSSKCKTTLDNKVFHSNILSNYIIEFILNLNKKN